MYVYYCPVCGGVSRRDKSAGTCKDCHSTAPEAKSEHQIEYYEQKSVDLYNTSKFWDYLLLEEEIKKNPLYDETKVAEYALTKIKKQDGEIQQIIEKRKSRAQNLYGASGASGFADLPGSTRCPSCNSSNVKKIFDINRINRIAPSAFAGGQSPEVEAQFECGDCGKRF